MYLYLIHLFIKLNSLIIYFFDIVSGEVGIRLLLPPVIELKKYNSITRKSITILTSFWSQQVSVIPLGLFDRLFPVYLSIHRYPLKLAQARLPSSTTTVHSRTPPITELYHNRNVWEYKCSLLSRGIHTGVSRRVVLRWLHFQHLGSLIHCMWRSTHLLPLFSCLSYRGSILINHSFFSQVFFKNFNRFFWYSFSFLKCRHINECDIKFQVFNEFFLQKK